MVVKKKRPPPKVSEEYRRFKDLLWRLVAVPKKEVEEKMEEYRESRKGRDEETEPGT